jgi:hypothetical protein
MKTKRRRDYRIEDMKTESRKVTQKGRNEPWLSAAIVLINKSIDLSKTDYKLLIFIFYEFISNRNLAKLISILYKKNETDVYFEITPIIHNKKLHKIIDRFDEIQDVMQRLDENGLHEWLEIYGSNY